MSTVSDDVYQLALATAIRETRQRFRCTVVVCPACGWWKGDHGDVPIYCDGCDDPHGRTKLLTLSMVTDASERGSE